MFADQYVNTCFFERFFLILSSLFAQKIAVILIESPIEIHMSKRCLLSGQGSPVTCPFYLMSLNVRLSWSTGTFWMIESWIVLNASWSLSTKRPRSQQVPGWNLQWLMALLDPKCISASWKLEGGRGGCGSQWRTSGRCTGEEDFFLTKCFKAILLFVNSLPDFFLWKNTIGVICKTANCIFPSGSFFFGPTCFNQVLWCCCCHSVHSPVTSYS